MTFTAPKVKSLGVFFLNKHGLKVYSKFFTKYSQTDFSKTQYDINTDQGQQKLYKAMYKKICKMNVASQMVQNPERTQIFSLKGYTGLFKLINELLIILVCEEQENYVLMESAINCIGNVLLLATTEKYAQKVIEENLDAIVISVDEIFDEGIIMCLEPNVVYDRMKMREGGEKNVTSSTSSNVKAPEQGSGGFSSLFGFAKNSLQKTLNFG